jgi:hypothetical protein
LLTAIAAVCVLNHNAAKLQRFDIHHDVRLALMQGYATAASGGLGQHAINIPLWQADACRIPLVCSLWGIATWWAGQQLPECWWYASDHIADVCKTPALAAMTSLH